MILVPAEVERNIKIATEHNQLFEEKKPCIILAGLFLCPGINFLQVFFLCKALLYFEQRQNVILNSA